MSQDDEETSAVAEGLKDGDQAVISDLDAAEVLQPGVGTFDFPASSIASQRAFVFEATVTNMAAIRNDQLDSASIQSHAQRVGIVAAAGEDAAEMGARSSPAFAWNLHRGERAFRQAKFRDLSGRKLRSDRYAVAVDHHHTLRTFTAMCFVDCRAPFLAVMKVASRKASSQSSNRRWSSIDNSFRHAFSHTSCSSQLRNRRQHVDPSRNSSGKSRHRAPVRNTQRMPSRHS